MAKRPTSRTAASEAATEVDLKGSGDLALYRTRDVLQLLGISRRQLQYWAQTNLVRPSVKTRGGHHRYCFEDLVVLKAAKRLIDAGVSVQRIRASIRELRKALPDVSLPLGQLTVVATGDVLLVFDEGTEFETLLGDEWVFPIGDFHREVEAWRTRRAPRTVKRDGVSKERTTSAKGA